jgi:hypothetical protein
MDAPARDGSAAAIVFGSRAPVAEWRGLLLLLGLELAVPGRG